MSRFLIIAIIVLVLFLVFYSTIWRYFLKPKKAKPTPPVTTEKGVSENGEKSES
jgi:hypothetical protein